MGMENDICEHFFETRSENYRKMKTKYQMYQIPIVHDYIEQVKENCSQPLLLLRPRVSQSIRATRRLRRLAQLPGP